MSANDPLETWVRASAAPLEGTAFLTGAQQDRPARDRRVRRCRRYTVAKALALPEQGVLIEAGLGGLAPPTKVAMLYVPTSIPDFERIRWA